MQPIESPFPCYWWSFGLENIGLEDVRPCAGTYGQYAYDQLPPIPFDLHGDFAWLANAPKCDNNIGNERSTQNATAITLLHKSAARMGLSLPDVFVKFMETPSLYERIWSNTDCFLDLCSELICSPIHGGYLIRFLADSQGCIFWYLYLTPDGKDHAVVSSCKFYGTDEEQWQDELLNDEIVFVAESFEAFMCRFWLENEIWLCGSENKTMSEIGRKYIEMYRNK